MKRVFNDKPLINISLRKFEKPSSSFKESLRKFCISVGLLQPGDSRDIIIDLFSLFLRASKLKRYLTINEIYNYIGSIDKSGTAKSNIRRNMLRLKGINFIEKTGNGYRLREWLSLNELINDFTKFKIEPTIERIRDYAKLLDESEVK